MQREMTRRADGSAPTGSAADAGTRMHRLLLNTGSNYVILVMRIVVTFFLTPVYVRYLGVYDFGIWELVVAILGYAGLLDLGLGFSISRFIAKYRAQDDHEALLAVFNTVTAFLSSIGLSLALIALCLATWYPQVLPAAAGSHQSYSVFLAIIALQVFISFPGVVAGGCLDGYQQYYVRNFLTFIDAFIVTGITLTFINKENALILLASTSTFSLLWKCVAYLVILRKEPDYPLYFGSQYLSKSMLRSLLGFGIKGFIQGVSYQIQSRSGILLIGFFLGAGSVPLFTVPANLAAYLGSITETGSQAFMPHFAALDAQGRRDEILPVYLFASKILVAIMALMAIGLLLLGTDFITLWVGPRFRGSSSEVLPYLVLSTFVVYVNPFGPRYLTALGRHGIYAKVAPVALVLNLLISAMLARKLGIVGIVVGTVAAALVVSGSALKVSCGLLRISVGTYLKRALLPLVVPGVAMIAVVVFIREFVALNSFARVFIVAISGSAVYGAVFLAAGLSRSERTRLVRMFVRSTERST
jgi:O-antigen/teichoic acid export membrane protein